MRTAPFSTDQKQNVTITHPYHPCRGRQFQLIERRNCWGQWRVCYLAEDDLTVMVPESWTDAGPQDPFIEQAQGRAIARTADLLELAQMTRRDIKQIMPKT